MAISTELTIKKWIEIQICNAITQETNVEFELHEIVDASIDALYHSFRGGSMISGNGVHGVRFAVLISFLQVKYPMKMK